MIASSRGIRIRPEIGRGPWRADPCGRRGSVAVTLFVGDVRGGCEAGRRGNTPCYRSPRPRRDPFRGPLAMEERIRARRSN